jgi:regulator of replication initiation timing
MMFGLNYATHMRALLRLNHHVEIRITDSTRLKSSRIEEDERPNHKTGDFTGLCFMRKSSRCIFDSDSDVSDDSSPESLSSRVIELDNALCNQDKLLCKIFYENKRLNLELESSFSEIASLRSVHDDMSANPCDRCTMIKVNYADLWLIHSRVAGLLDSARLELRELKTRSTLLGACTACPVHRSDLEAAAVEIKDFKHKLDLSSRYSVLSPPCEACVSLKGKLFHATKENTELQQEVAYLTARLEKTVLSEKMIEDLSRVVESEMSYPVLRERERSLHTCAQDVQITRTVTI